MNGTDTRLYILMDCAANHAKFWSHIRAKHDTVGTTIGNIRPLFENERRTGSCRKMCRKRPAYAPSESGYIISTVNSRVMLLRLYFPGNIYANTIDANITKAGFGIRETWDVD